MRILRVAQTVYPDVKGGGAYHVHAMSRDQAAMGHDVIVLTVGDGQRREERDGYMVVRYPSWGSLLGNDLAPGIGRHLFRAGEYDVVHAHSHLYAATNLAALRRRMGHPSLAITNHGLYSQTSPKWIFDWYLRTVGRWTFNTADTVFCYTSEDRERLRRIGVSTPVEIIHNGIDTDRFTPDGDTHSAIDESWPNVLFVGRLVDGKRPLDAVEALAELRDSHPNAELYICGDGPLADDVRQRASDLNVEAAVTFLGQVEYEEMPEVYRATDALILPSRVEGLPRTVLEAMASDVSVVVSELAQLAPVVGKGGETVPVGNIEGFATGLRQVLDSPERYNPRTEVSGYRWSDTVQQTTKVLAKLSNSTAGRVDE